MATVTAFLESVDCDAESPEIIDPAPLGDLVVLTEDPHWWQRGTDPSVLFRYTVSWFRAGAIVEKNGRRMVFGYDSLLDARSQARELEKESAGDRLWSLVEAGAMSGLSFFNQFLDPDDDRDPGDAPPSCGVSGLWL